MGNLPLKYLLLTFAMLGLVFVPIASAATTATVTATVTAQNVSVSVSDGSISYGTLALSATNSTLVGEANDPQTVTNNGNVAEDITIRGANSGSWTLGATSGADQYFHKFCNDTDNDCSSTASNYTALTTSYQTLKASVAGSGTVLFQLQIGMPSSTAVYTQQSVDVTVQASAS